MMEEEEDGESWDEFQARGRLNGKTNRGDETNRGQAKHLTYVACAEGAGSSGGSKPLKPPLISTDEP